MLPKALPFIATLQPSGVLSFPPNADSIELRRLNVLIGPNGSGKSNFIEVLDLLRGLPTDLASLVRQGGGISEWLYKGADAAFVAGIDAILNVQGIHPTLRYRLEVGAAGERLELLDEAIEDAKKTDSRKTDVRFYYRFQRGNPVLSLASGEGPRKLNRDTLDPQQSVLSQRKDPDLYPELSAVATAFSRIALFRDWSFGRASPFRQPQPTDLPNDVLLPDARNLAMFLNQMEHGPAWRRMREILGRFLPRFDNLSTKVNAGTLQLWLHEKGLATRIPATRLSEGTVRFIVLLAILLKPDFAPLICIEEPELGMHPDAIAILGELIQEASRTTQMVVTTHSDVLLSALSNEPESVMVCENLRGSTAIRRLNRPELDHWLSEYSLGEIWRLGEIGGNT